MAKESNTMTIEDDGTVSRRAWQVKNRIPQMIQSNYHPDDIANFIVRHYLAEESFDADDLQMAIGIAIDEAQKRATLIEKKNEHGCTDAYCAVCDN